MNIPAFFKRPIAAIILLAGLWVTGIPGAQAQTVPTGFNNALVMGGWHEPGGFTFESHGRR